MTRHIATYFVRDILLIEMVYLHLLLSMACPQKQHEVFHKLIAVVVDVLLWILPNEEHLADVALGLRMHLETVLIPHLTFADLTVPSEALQAFRLHLVRDIFCRPDLGFRHRGGGY
jgi:hypothetical protein